MTYGEHELEFTFAKNDGPTVECSTLVFLKIQLAIPCFQSSKGEVRIVGKGIEASVA